MVLAQLWRQIDEIGIAQVSTTENYFELRVDACNCDVSFSGPTEFVRNGRRPQIHRLTGREHILSSLATEFPEVWAGPSSGHSKMTMPKAVSRRRWQEAWVTSKTEEKPMQLTIAM